MVAKVCMPYPVKYVFEVYEDIVQILLMLKVPFTQILKLKICSVVLFSTWNPACCSAIGFESVQDDFQHDFTWMTDEANGSVILAEL